MTAQVPVAHGLFTEATESPSLLGSRCCACRNVTFPQQVSCPRCAGESMELTELPSRGVLWSWTVQRFEPKEPFRPPAGGFSPYGVGYVDLGEVIVESRLTVNDPDLLSIGQPMHLQLVAAFTSATGERVVTFAFAPADAS